MTADKLKAILEATLAAEHVAVRDDSAQHRGHAGVKPSGGGHYAVIVVADAFEGKMLLDRHRAVYAVVDMENNAEIHALSIKAYTPVEWAAQN